MKNSGAPISAHKLLLGQ